MGDREVSIWWKIILSNKTASYIILSGYRLCLVPKSDASWQFPLKTNNNSSLAIKNGNFIKRREHEAGNQPECIRGLQREVCRLTCGPVIWCWLDNRTNWNCHNLMKVPMWYTRNTNLSELCLRTEANVNKIHKERKKIHWFFFLNVPCSYLKFLTLKLPLQAVFWASHQSLAFCRECVCTQLFPEAPRVRVSSIRCPCWTPCRRENVASFSKESWLYVLKSFPFIQGQSPQHQEKQKVFSPMTKKNKYGRITIFPHQTI